MGGLASAANMGFSVQVAHFIGANDFEAARRVLRQSLICCLIWALIISIIGIGISPFLPIGWEVPQRLPVMHPLFCHLRLLRYLLPDGRTGRIDAEVLWQHEDSIHP